MSAPASPAKRPKAVRIPGSAKSAHETGPVITDIRHYFLKNARVLDGFRLGLRFKDDFIAELNFSDWVLTRKRGPLRRPLKDERYFQQVFIDHGALTWPNGYDLDPCAVRQWAEQGFCD